LSSVVGGFLYRKKTQKIGTSTELIFSLSFCVAIFDMTLLRTYNRSQRFGKHCALPTKTLTKRQREFQRNYERCKRLLSGWIKMKGRKMEEEEVILIDKVAERVLLSTHRVRQLVSERRKTGLGNFPLPFSPPGSKLRWRASDISYYIASQNAEPSRDPPPRVSPLQLRREEDARTKIASAEKAALLRHAEGRRQNRRSRNADKRNTD